MKEEDIIRDEAAIFACNELEDNSFGNFGHKKFLEKLKNELKNLYQPEYKMIFLDQLIINTKFYLKEHEKECGDEENCETYMAFQKILFYIGQEIDELPKIIHQSDKHNGDREKVFISYSHLDVFWLNKLKRHFKPFEKKIEFWDDSKIKGGTKWKE